MPNRIKLHTVTICRNTFDRICSAPFAAYAIQGTHENFLLLQRLVVRGQSPYRLIGWEGINIFRYYFVPGSPEGLSSENLIGCSVQEVLDNTMSLPGVSGEYRLLGFEQYLGNLGRQGAARIGLRLPPRDEPFQTITGQLEN